GNCLSSAPFDEPLHNVDLRVRAWLITTGSDLMGQRPAHVFGDGRAQTTTDAVHNSYLLARRAPLYDGRVVALPSAKTVFLVRREVFNFRRRHQEYGKTHLPANFSRKRENTPLFTDAMRA